MVVCHMILYTTTVYDKICTQRCERSCPNIDLHLNCRDFQIWLPRAAAASHLKRKQETYHLLKRTVSHKAVERENYIKLAIYVSNSYLLGMIFRSLYIV